ILTTLVTNKIDRNINTNVLKVKCSISPPFLNKYINYCWKMVDRCYINTIYTVFLKLWQNE
ncbi:MAG: hypothetical protein ACE5EA_05690, partial [Nitrospirota bacterium]